MSIDQEKLNQFMQKAVGDLGATFHAALIVIGDKLGLYRKMADVGPVTSSELAKHAGVSERYVREWLAANAASGYINYEAATARYSLSPEQAFALAEEGSPAFLPGAFQLATAALKAEPKITEAFRTGSGVGWHEHDPALFHGTERFFRPGYAANLISSWIPSLDGVEAKLRKGARVADVGCGHGASTILMAQAYLRSGFTGFDYHEPSIKRAREAADEAGVADRVNFEVASAKNYPARDYDFIAFFDCLHDMGDPVGAATYVRKTLAPDGTLDDRRAFANDRVEDNLNPVGALYYSASTLVCTPASLSQEVGLALGAQAGEARMREVVTKGGFTRFRRATETPFNMVFEARP